jgi:hypothetical protein
MQKIRIDFDNPGLPQHISAVENDSQSRFFQATLYENGKAYTAPEGAAYSIMYHGFGPQNQGWYDTINDGAGKRAACKVSGNVVTCEIARQALQVPGHVSIVLCVTTGKGYMLKSWPIECDCKNDRYDSTAEIQSFFYVTQISNESWTQAIQAVEELKNTIDPTLSLSGKAADAKATGDAIQGVKSDLDETAISSYARMLSLSNVELKGSETAIESQSDRSITFSVSEPWGGIKKRVKVLKNTHYTVKFTCADNTSAGFCDIIDANEIGQIITKFFNGGNVVVNFDSGDNNSVTIRIGNAETPNQKYTISDLFILTDNVTTLTDNVTTLTDNVTALTDNVTALTDNVTTLTDNYFQHYGWLNYYDGVLEEKVDESGKWRYSDYIDITNTETITVYSSQYYDNSFKYNVSPISFYDENKALIKAYSSSNANNEVIEIKLALTDIPDDAVFARFTIQINANNIVRLSKNILYDIKAMADAVDNKIAEIKKETESKKEKIINFRYLKKINLIGDSITQGVGAEIPEKSSYAGILRKMLFVENDGQLNYGFESFSPLYELTTIKSKMVEQAGNNGFSRKWDGTVCYGNDEFSAVNRGSKFSVKIKKPFNYLRVSYKDGIEGEFTLSANDIVILTVRTTSGTETAKMSDAIDISKYPAEQVYTFTLVSGSMTISGVELGYNTNYVLFNNYGRAGIGASSVSGELLAKECAADLVIYALGTNAITQSDVDNVTEVLKGKNCYKVVLDLAMKSTKYDKTGMSFYLKQIADNIGALYVKISDYVPVDSNGIIDTSYLISDGLHPSELGHECIAEYIAKMLNLSVRSKGLVDSIFDKW